jgi:hypothetical protein
MRASFNLSAKSLKDFEGNCMAMLSKVGNGSRKALVEACNIISEDSLNQVPRDTDTLALSQYWEITGHWQTGWTATIGYGGNGDPVNPKTGRKASEYALVVHEDLTALHIIGKAKYLEDPVRAYASARFPRTVFKYVKPVIEE